MDEKKTGNNNRRNNNSKQQQWADTMQSQYNERKTMKTMPDEYITNRRAHRIVYPFFTACIQAECLAH